jgi:uncharacterized membrane protein
MSNTRYPAIIFAALVIASITVPIFYYSALPDRIASHFDFNNRADGWMKKESFLIIETAVILFLSAMFFSIIHFLPRFPDSMINLPNKEYWLKSENREEAFRKLRDFFYWTGTLTLGFLLLVFYEVCSVNMAGRNTMSREIWIYLLLFLAAVTFLVIKIYLQFNRIEKPN